MWSLSSKKDKEDKQGCFVTKAITALFVVLFIQHFWPKVIPFQLFEFWHLKADLPDILLASWPVFAWGAGVTTLYHLLTRNDPDENENAEAHLLNGFGISLMAGVLEELAFRWILFYNAIIVVKLSNFLFFGWMGFGLPQWIYTHLACPVADFFTLHYLHPYLFNGFGWAVGGAILASNGNFRDGHEYQGWFGWTNSWFCGMFLFYIMFTYGLPAAIIVHFLYDFFIFCVKYFDMLVEREVDRFTNR